MESKMEQAHKVLSEISTLIEHATDTKLLNSYLKIERRLKSEIRYLQKQSSRTNKNSSNLPYLYGIFDVTKASEGVQRVICDMRKYKIVIDVVCDDGKTWKKIIARNPQSLHLIWASDGQYGDKDAVKKVLKYVDAAKTESDFSPPKVVCVFTKGVTVDMAEHLESVGVEVEGERVAVSSDTLRRLEMACVDSDDSGEESIYSDDESSHSDEEPTQIVESTNIFPEIDLIEELTSLSTDEKIFLDVTSMVIYVSDVCNGGADFEFKDQMMAEQAEQERVSPTKPIITKQLENRRLITSATALENFKTFVALLGGEKEKERANELVARITVVPDSISERFQKLKKGGKIKEKSKVIFGTADRLRCNILTSNESFIRAAAAQNIHVSAIIHQSRALSELKRVEESAL